MNLAGLLRRHRRWHPTTVEPHARDGRRRPGPVRRIARFLVQFFALLSGAWVAAVALALVLLRIVDPPRTAVMIERAVAARVAGRSLDLDYRPLPRTSIAPAVFEAVVAAEDSRFFLHGGIDWEAVETAIEDHRERGRPLRGASTITQQLVKNVFLFSRRSWVRKALEVPLAWAAEFVLGKPRILELYVNIVEWGDGVFGIEAASRHHYGKPASRLTRYEAAALAACIPDPQRRSPARMPSLARTILARMNAGIPGYRQPVR
jgi:monofunctional biosynthetic peptidoglycan transglycosylase